MALTVTPGSNHGNLNGTTPVTIVAAPGAGVQRTVRSVRFANIDTAAVTIRVRKTVAGTPYEFDSVTGLVVDGKFWPLSNDDVLNLTATDQSLTAVMGGAAATTNPSFEASYIDYAVT